MDAGPFGQDTGSIPLGEGLHDIFLGPDMGIGRVQNIPVFPAEQVPDVLQGIRFKEAHDRERFPQGEGHGIYHVSVRVEDQSAAVSGDGAFEPVFPLDRPYSPRASGGHDHKGDAPGFQRSRGEDGAREHFVTAAEQGAVRVAEYDPKGHHRILPSRYLPQARTSRA